MIYAAAVYRDQFTVYQPRTVVVIRERSCVRILYIPARIRWYAGVCTLVCMWPDADLPGAPAMRNHMHRRERTECTLSPPHTHWPSSQMERLHIDRFAQSNHSEVTAVTSRKQARPANARPLTPLRPFNISVLVACITPFVKVEASIARAANSPGPIPSREVKYGICRSLDRQIPD